MKTIKNLKAEEIRKSILQLAIQGKLVKQDPNDEPASELVKRIYAEKQKLIKEGKIKKDKTESYIFKGDDNCYYEKIGNNEPVKLDDLPFDIPDNWMWIKQKNICWLNNGVKTNSENLPYLEAKVIRGKAEPIFVNSGIIVDSLCKVILVDGENSGEIMTPPMRGYMGSTFKIFSAVDNFNYDFLLLIFLLNKKKYKNSKIGAAIPHLNKDLFRESYIAVPPLNEQQRIVSKINSFEPLINKYDELEQKLTSLENEFLEKLKKSILQYAIEGKLVKQDPNDEPASVLLERIKKEKEKLIKEGKIKRDKNESFIYQGDDKNYYENLPQSWCFTSMNQLSKIIGDGIHGTPLFCEDGLYHFINGSNLIDGKILINNTKKCSRDEFEKYKKPLDLNTILISINGTLGNIAVYDHENIILGKSAGYISLVNSSLLDWIILFLKSSISWNYFKLKYTGTTIKNIPLSALRTLFVAFPPLNEQVKIINKIKKLNLLIDKLN